MSQIQTILLVDDGENDVFLMHQAFREAQPRAKLREVDNGERAIAYLKGEGTFADRKEYPLPSVIILDLNMPKQDGFVVLSWLKTQSSFRHVTKIILTASMRTEDVERAFELGANSFLVKPAAFCDLVAMIRNLGEWLSLNCFPPLNRSVRR